MINKGFLVLAIVMILGLLMAGCAITLPTADPTPTQKATQAPTAEPTTAPTPTPEPTMEPTPTPDPGVITIKAPDALLKLMEQWNGKYVIVVGKDTGIKTLDDFNGKKIYCDMYAVGMEKALDDMSAFKAAAGVQMDITLGNNVPQDITQLKMNDKVGFIPKATAADKAFQNNPDLKIIVFN